MNEEQKKEVMREMGSRGGKAFASKKSKEFFIERAKHMNAVKKANREAKTAAETPQL